MPDDSHTLSTRKEEHVTISTTCDVQFRRKSSGFDRYDFDYVALPEIDFEEINTRVKFLGKTLELPLLISSMTGGYSGATIVNRLLAELCQEKKIALGLGSMRQLLKENGHWESYHIARQSAPDIVLLANIGATELVLGATPECIEELALMLGADGVILHLNPLQELLQPEGTTRFRGVLDAIENLLDQISLPVVVKEVGAGISREVAERLLGIGVQIIDVAGAGGTSWAGVEILRSDDESHPLEELWDCGIPTAECVQEVTMLRSQYSFTLIASGGISTGFDAAKALILGADLIGVARPILQVLQRDGFDEAKRFVDRWELQLRSSMFITGAPTIDALHSRRLRIR